MTPVSVPTSATTGTPPSAVARSRTMSMPRATSTTCAPAAASRSAVAPPMPPVAPVTTAMRPVSAAAPIPLRCRSASAGAPGSGDDAIHRYKPQELLARADIIQEHALHRARYRLRVLLLDTTHHHAQVIRFDDDADTLRLQLFGQRFGDLRRQPLLHLETAREYF